MKTFSYFLSNDLLPIPTRRQIVEKIIMMLSSNDVVMMMMIMMKELKNFKTAFKLKMNKNVRHDSEIKVIKF